jgi:peptidoglycan/LPS O-acetylase OafA/YrhL
VLCTFFSGATCFVMRERIVLSWSVFWPLAALLGASSLDKHLFFAVFLATLAYLVLVLAYLPGGAVRRYNRVGDYSYGTYIYAFPVQQSVAALVPGVSLAPMIALASVGTLALAALSWHLIERPALELKEALSRARRPAYGPSA